MFLKAIFLLNQSLGNIRYDKYNTGISLNKYTEYTIPSNGVIKLSVGYYFAIYAMNPI